MAKGNLLKSMFGIGSASSKSCKKNEENSKYKFDETLLKDPVAIVTYKELDSNRQFIEGMLEYSKNIQTQINDNEYLNIMDKMVLSKSLMDMYSGSMHTNGEDYFEMCGQIYALISVELLNKITTQTNCIFNKFVDYQSSIRNDTLQTHKKNVINIVKNIKSLKKNSNDPNKSINKKNTPKDNITILAGDTNREQLNHNEEKLEDELSEMELYLIGLCSEQRVLAEILLDDIINTHNYHENCRNLIQQKIYMIEDCAYERINKPILGLSLRDLRSTYNQDISVLLTRAFRFMIDNNVLHVQGLFNEPIDDDKMYAFKEFLLSGVLDMTLFKNSINVVAVGVTVYLKELPDPLIHMDDTPDWSVLSTQKSYVRRCHHLVNIINTLSYLQRVNLLYIMAFLNFLHVYSTDTNISCVYLATVFVPSVFSSDYLKTIDPNPLIKIFAEVIDFFKTFFPTEYKRYNFGQHVYFECASLSNRLTTDDSNNTAPIKDTKLLKNETLLKRHSAIDPSPDQLIGYELTKNRTNSVSHKSLETLLSVKDVNFVSYNADQTDDIKITASDDANEIDGPDMNSNWKKTSAHLTNRNNDISSSSDNNIPRKLSNENIDDHPYRTSSDQRYPSGSYSRKLSLASSIPDLTNRICTRGYSVSFCVEKFDKLSKSTILHDRDHHIQIYNNKPTNIKIISPQVLQELGSVSKKGSNFVNKKAIYRLSASSEGQLNIITVKERIKQLENFADHL